MKTIIDVFNNKDVFNNHEVTNNTNISAYLGKKLHNYYSDLSQINDEILAFLDDCIFLNPYATLYRYPEGDLMPERETVIKAISIANKILGFIKSKITFQPFAPEITAAENDKENS